MEYQNQVRQFTVRCYRVLGQTLLCAILSLPALRTSAQPLWVPASISVSIPIRVEIHSSELNKPGSSSDTTFDADNTVGFTNLPSTFQAVRLGDSEYFSWQQQIDVLGLFLTGHGEMHFKVDSASSVLRDFVITLYGDTDFTDFGDHYTRASRSVIRFEQIPFSQLRGDSGISVLLPQSECMRLLDTADYTASLSYFHNSGQRLRISDQTWRTIGLSSNGYYYRCSMRFEFRVQDDVDRSRENTLPRLAYSIELPSGDLRFAFPLRAAHTRFSVSNSIGAELKEVEIPEGQTDLHLMRDWLPPGLYFARLGEMATSFVVP